MEVAVVSDIHGNLVALREVLDNIEEDFKICCGDIVGYGPEPKKCLEIVRNEFDIIVQGNHDRKVGNRSLPPSRGLGKGYNNRIPSHSLAIEELTVEQLDFLKNLPEKEKQENMMIVHSHPERTDEYVYPDDFRSVSDYIGYGEVLLLGHTHIPYGYNKSKLVLNPGSVGQPRDAVPKASYATIDTNELEYDIQRVDYNIKKVEEKIKEKGLPKRNYERLYNGK